MNLQNKKINIEYIIEIIFNLILMRKVSQNKIFFSVDKIN